MPRFFVPGENINEKRIRITGSDAVHITRSLRMKCGEKVIVCDMHSVEYECVINDFENNSVVLDIVSKSIGKTEPPYRLTLYQALPKSDKMELIVQKAVETGVYKIVPFISERCISRPDNKGIKTKTERWNKIAFEAAKQCGRGIIPEVSSVLSYREILESVSKADVPILFYEGDNTISLKKILSDVSDKKINDIAVIIGSEGGFSLEEVNLALEAGISAVGLGPRILRCETAPIVALGAISYALEL